MSRTITPYYSRENIVIYNHDCRELIPAINPIRKFLLTDPPYGIQLDTKNADRVASKDYCNRNNYEKVFGDNQQFEPRNLIKFPKMVIFGANNFATRLPNTKGWIVWDKTGGGVNVSPKGQADCELAWSNVTGGCRIFSQLWKGMLKGGSGEQGQARVHPTQKPIVLFEWILKTWGEDSFDVVLDPYLGSGSCLVAAARLGFKAVGIEIVEEYCKIAAERIDKELDAKATGAA